MRTIDVDGGRRICLHEAGDPGGFPVIVHHGTPSSGLLYERWETPGVRLIGMDRAGYGDSSRAPGRCVADAAADVEAVADALELERFATWGVSGGGPHALACAALCGERVTAVATLGSVAPWEAPGLDWLDGMGEGNLEEFALCLEGEAALLPFLDTGRRWLIETSVEDSQRAYETLLGDADKAALRGSLAQWMHDAETNGLAKDADGWLDDDLAFVAPWGFELGAIARPVLIAQGGDDRFVPRAHGEWLAEHVTGAEAWIDDTEGHLTWLENRIPEVHGWLLAHS